jgi:hypothetical protein
MAAKSLHEVVQQAHDPCLSGDASSGRLIKLPRFEGRRTSSGRINAVTNNRPTPNAGPPAQASIREAPTRDSPGGPPGGGKAMECP